MCVEELLNKKISDVTYENLMNLGEDIALIDEEFLLEWAKFNNVYKPNIYFHYKYCCVARDIRVKCKDFFEKGKVFHSKDLKRLFKINAYVLNEILDKLVQNNYLKELGESVYKVINIDDYGFVDLVISPIWCFNKDNYEPRVKRLETTLERLLFEKYIYEKDFLKEVETLLKNYSDNLLEKSQEEIHEFFCEHIHNVSRGYIIRLLVVKFAYKEMIEFMDFCVDQAFVEKLKYKYFDWKGEEDK